MDLDIYMVRHGETSSLKSRVFAGRSDIPLNEKGFIQASGLASRADLDETQICFSSPLSRCRQTSTSAFPGKKIVYDDDLSEIDFGLWEMKSWQEIVSGWPDDVEKWASPEMNFRFPGGESFEEFASRIRIAALRMENMAGIKGENTRVAVIAHSGVIKVLICLWLGIPVENFTRFAVDAASVSLVRISDGYGYLAFLNDTSHVQKNE